MARDGNCGRMTSYNRLGDKRNLEQLAASQITGGFIMVDEACSITMKQKCMDIVLDMKLSKMRSIIFE